MPACTGPDLADLLCGLPAELLALVLRDLTLLDRASLRECSRAMRDAIDRLGLRAGLWSTPSAADIADRWMAARYARGYAPPARNRVYYPDSVIYRHLHGTFAAGVLTKLGVRKPPPGYVFSATRIDTTWVDAADTELDMLDPVPADQASQRARLCVIRLAQVIGNTGFGGRPAALKKEVSRCVDRFRNGMGGSSLGAPVAQWLLAHTKARTHHSPCRPLYGRSWRNLEDAIARALWLNQNRNKIRRLEVSGDSVGDCARCGLGTVFGSVSWPGFCFETLVVDHVSYNLWRDSSTVRIPPGVRWLELSISLCDVGTATRWFVYSAAEEPAVQAYDLHFPASVELVSLDSDPRFGDRPSSRIFANKLPFRANAVTYRHYPMDVVFVAYMPYGIEHVAGNFHATCIGPKVRTLGVPLVTLLARTGSLKSITAIEFLKHSGRRYLGADITPWESPDTFPAVRTAYIQAQDGQSQFDYAKLPLGCEVRSLNGSHSAGEFAGPK